MKKCSQRKVEFFFIYFKLKLKNQAKNAADYEKVEKKQDMKKTRWIK